MQRTANWRKPDQAKNPLPYCRKFSRDAGIKWFTFFAIDLDTYHDLKGKFTKPLQILYKLGCCATPRLVIANRYSYFKNYHCRIKASSYHEKTSRRDVFYVYGLNQGFLTQICERRRISGCRFLFLAERNDSRNTSAFAGYVQIGTKTHGQTLNVIFFISITLTTTNLVTRRQHISNYPYHLSLLHCKLEAFIRQHVLKCLPS